MSQEHARTVFILYIITVLYKLLQYQNMSQAHASLCSFYFVDINYYTDYCGSCRIYLSQKHASTVLFCTY